MMACPCMGWRRGVVFFVVVYVQHCTCSPLTDTLVHDRVVLSFSLFNFVCCLLDGWTMDMYVCVSYVCWLCTNPFLFSSLPSLLLPSSPSPSFFPQSQPPSHLNPPYFYFGMENGWIKGWGEQAQEEKNECVCVCVFVHAGRCFFFFSNVVNKHFLSYCTLSVDNRPIIQLFSTCFCSVF